MNLLKKTCISLTLLFTCLCGCTQTYTQQSGQEYTACKTRAHISGTLQNAAQTEHEHTASPFLRVGITPFHVPENMLFSNNWRRQHAEVTVPLQLATAFHQELLRSSREFDPEGIFTYELTTWQQTAITSTDFFTGNYHALSWAKEAGFDVIALGYVDQIHSPDSAILYTKLIDTRTGATLWYGETSIQAAEPSLFSLSTVFPPSKRGNPIPSGFATRELAYLASCAGQAAWGK